MIMSGLASSSLSEAARVCDLVVAASGYEPRASAILSADWSTARRRVALCFEENKADGARPENDAAFSSAGFATQLLSGFDMNDAFARSKRLLETIPAGGRAVVDISCMTRVWYGGLVRAIRHSAGPSELEVLFVYYRGAYPADYVQCVPNEIVAPVDGFASLLPPDKPVALVLGVGFDKARAAGLLELLEPKRLWLVRAGEFLRLGEMPSGSHAPLGRGRVDDLEIPLDDPVASFRSLDSLVGGLRMDYSVVLVNLGPKLLGLQFFLLAALDPALSVWRVSPGRHAAPVLVQAAPKPPVVCRTVWTAEE